MKTNFSHLLFFASIGVLLLATAGSTPLEESSIASLEKRDAGEKITLRAEVAEASGRNNAFLELEDGTGNISAVQFDSGKSYSPGDRMLLTGRVGIYEGDLQVVIGESSIIPS
jgi:DNA/RNA endonuclease YhcR with UshA esterase domain